MIVIISDIRNSFHLSDYCLYFQIKVAKLKVDETQISNQIVTEADFCDGTLCETTKFISLLNRIESSVKAFWTANGAGR